MSPHDAPVIAYSSSATPKIVPPSARKTIRGMPSTLGGGVIRCLVSGRVALATRFIEKPNASFGVVDKGFKKTGRCDVVMFVAEIVGFAHRGNNPLIVVA